MPNMQIYRAIALLNDPGRHGRVGRAGRLAAQRNRLGRQPVDCLVARLFTQRPGHDRPFYPQQSDSGLDDRIGQTLRRPAAVIAEWSTPAFATAACGSFSDSIDETVWHAIWTRSGGEIVSLPND